MRKLLFFPAILVAFHSAAFAQAVSGGQASQAGGTVVQGNPYNSTNPGDQYLQQKQMNNLANHPSAKVSVAKLGPARPAKAAELTAGASVNDNTGAAMAQIAEVDPDGVVLAMGTAKVKIPADAFGHNKAGLLLDMSKAQFEQIVAQANLPH
jgi:hypothetical protein